MKKIVHLPNEHIKSMQRCRRAQVNIGCLEQDHRSSNNMTKNRNEKIQIGCAELRKQSTT
jgi:hypothetical protein